MAAAINILVINAGSSSLKFHFYEMPGENMICSGIAERIGKEGASLHLQLPGNDNEEFLPDKKIEDHADALEQIVRLLRDDRRAVSKMPVELIAHRVVHGGDDLTEAVLITDKVKETIERLSALAPLHNPVNLRCIRLMEQLFPGVKQVAVFDTAFHHHLPETASRYAIPHRLYEEDGVKAYGFHGISHKFVADQAMQYLADKSAKLISMHLGNGCSIAAIKAGRSMDTSMGFGPVSGLVMATRSGDVDPSVILYLMEKKKMSPEDIDIMLNKESGMQALCGMTDMRDIEKAAASGNRQAVFACELYTYRLRKYIGAYSAVLNGADALVFTGGVGTNSSFIRELVCTDLESLGIRIDAELNRKAGEGIREIGTKSEKVRILVIPTNEELEIARQSGALYDRQP